jgi:hypothetical protein
MHVQCSACVELWDTHHLWNNEIIAAIQEALGNDDDCLAATLEDFDL